MLLFLLPWLNPHSIITYRVCVYTVYVPHISANQSLSSLVLWCCCLFGKNVGTEHALVPRSLLVASEMNLRALHLLNAVRPRLISREWAGGRSEDWRTCSVQLFRLLISRGTADLREDLDTAMKTLPKWKLSTCGPRKDRRTSTLKLRAAVCLVGTEQAVPPSWPPLGRPKLLSGLDLRLLSREAD